MDPNVFVLLFALATAGVVGLTITWASRRFDRKYGPPPG